MSTEVALIAVAAAIYLVDCVVLLERGQAVLEALRARLRLTLGTPHYQIGGRAVALLNPATPFIPAFRSLPLFAGAGHRGLKLSTALRAVSPLALQGLLQFLLVFGALPVFLYRAPGWPFLAALVLAYLNAIAMLGVLWWRFRRAGIAPRPLAGLGFGWLVCLPLSVNALRKAGLAFDVAPDARRALRYLPADARAAARDGLRAQMTEAMQELDEADPAYRRLADAARQLDPASAHGRD